MLAIELIVVEPPTVQDCEFFLEKVEKLGNLGIGGFQGGSVVVLYRGSVVVVQVPIGMLFHSPCISLGDKPKARLQSLGLDVVRQPLRPVRELLTIPLLNPVMLAVLSTVVTIIKLNVLESVSFQVRGDPVCIADNILFRHLIVITAPAVPHHSCLTEIPVIKRNIIGKAQSFSEIVREDAHPGMSQHGDREIEQVLILIVALHPC